MQLEQEKQEKAAPDTNTNDELDEAHLTIKKSDILVIYRVGSAAEQKIPLNTIVQQPRMEQRDNFSKGLSGGGACLDS
ncbi:unnamed protein product [Didymodactylos carnosus]|uniref:Uncharacterized protein n=1 Tax=Didymodactylos carnosus TaxID=1234261 RepID=A0A8S2ER92_9BILA|nr:unnamed protein product [Didymodactylos carnosus]CAF4061112.1 unnamed protein product [Didymodactylos carnosus]